MHLVILDVVKAADMSADSQTGSAQNPLPNDSLGRGFRFLRMPETMEISEAAKSGDGTTINVKTSGPKMLASKCSRLQAVRSIHTFAQIYAQFLHRFTCTCTRTFAHTHTRALKDMPC